MRDIYSGATRVLIWLGEDNADTTDDALTLIRKAAELARAESGSAIPRPSKIVTEHPSAHQNLLRGFPAIDDAAWSALVDFLDRPWFERVWIIQEVSTRTESLEMIGGREINWTDIAIAALWFSIKGYNGLIPGFGRINNVTQIRRARELPDTKCAPLLNRLITIRSFKSKWPHDKIFAVLGVSLEGFSRENYPRLKVNYERPSIGVYIDAVRHCLDRRDLESGSDHKLGVLSLVQHKSGDEDDTEASWVPRWDKPNQSWILGLQPYARFFYASGSLDACILPSENEKALVLKGLDIDSVVMTDHSLKKVANNSPEMFMALKKLWKSTIDEYKRHPPNYLGVVDTERTFALAVTAGSTVDRLARNSEQYDEQDFAAYWHSNVEYEKTYVHNDHEINLRDEDDAPKATPSSSERGITFGETICRSRVFFRTLNGAMGIGPETTLPGDRVCVLFGSVVPFILRQVNEHFLLVGECFSSGLMRGEAIAAMIAGIIQEKVFDIR